MIAGWRARALCALFPDLPWIAEPDERDVASVRAMEAVCDACPVHRDCGAFADRYEVTAGFWAGKDRTPAPPKGAVA